MMSRLLTTFWVSYLVGNASFIGVILGLGPLLFISLIAFLIAFFASFLLLEGNYMGKTRWSWKRGLTLALIPTVLFSTWIGVMGSSPSTQKSMFYPIYHATAPFGVLWRDVEGRFIFGSGYITTELVETYIIKYMIGDALHTKTFDATVHALIVDGSFVLEEQIVETTYPITLFEVVQSQTTEGYVIHIPFLPPTNGSTVQFEIVG